MCVGVGLNLIWGRAVHIVTCGYGSTFQLESRSYDHISSGYGSPSIAVLWRLHYQILLKIFNIWIFFFFLFLQIFEKSGESNIYIYFFLENYNKRTNM